MSKGSKGGKAEEEYVGRVNCAICMDTDTEEYTPWGVLLSCGHVFHLHCAQNCLNVKPECPTCRASCSPSQVQRVYINNAVDPAPVKLPNSDSRRESKPSKSPTFKPGRESVKEPAFECSIYPPIKPVPGQDGTASTPTDTAPSSNQPPLSEYPSQYGWTGTSGTSTGTSVHVGGEQEGMRHRTNTSTASAAQYPGGYGGYGGYDPVYGYQQYQYHPQYQPHPGHPPYQTYATLAYDPRYPNQPRIVHVQRNRRKDVSDSTAVGLGLGCLALAACLVCTVQ